MTAAPRAKRDSYPRPLLRLGLVGVPMLVRARVLALVAGGDGEAA